jgi:hypothetical protein
MVMGIRTRSEARRDGDNSLCLQRDFKHAAYVWK